MPEEIFAAQIASAQTQARACAINVSACEETALRQDEERVMAGQTGAFQVSWAWFREALAAAKIAGPADRAKAMRSVAAHLAEQASEMGSSQAVSDAVFKRARMAANTALARPEFRSDAGPTWIERQMARLDGWIMRFFLGIGGLGQHAPWLAPLIEWGCFGLAATGLMWFAWRNLRQAALRIVLSETATLASAGDRASADWTLLADEQAGKSNWREGVYCLYWAAIALLEERRAWRPNPTRTPREYLKLLRPASEMQRSLRDLTSAFEWAWYGHAEADESAYRAARASFATLQVVRVEHAVASTNEEFGPSRELAPAEGV